MADFNRLRWAYYALRSNGELRRAMLASDSRCAYDSQSLILQVVRPPAGACIVLWDGFNSYLELLRARPELSHRNDLTFAYVGDFAEVAAALPQGSLRLFPDRDMFSTLELNAPVRFKAMLKLKTSLRGIKNYTSARARHRQLSDGGNLVFCGLLRPTKQVVASLLTNAKLHSLRELVEKLGGHHWQSDPAKIHSLVRDIYRRSKELNCASAEDYAGIYAILNICSRLFIVNALHERGCKVFINEFGFQKNFDPYDSFSYGNNTYLDFGSSRGACYWYPRTMDMQATGKQFLALRMIQEHQSLSEYLDLNTVSDFVDQMRAHVEDVVLSAALTVKPL